MLNKKKFIPCISAVTLAAVLFLNVTVLDRVFSYPFTPARVSPLEKYAALDLSGILGGVRRFAADIAWVQLLLYYGTPEKELDKETEFKLSIATIKFLFNEKTKKKHKHGSGEDCGQSPHEHDCGHTHSHDDLGYHPDWSGGNYPEILKHCYRIVYLDPFFYYTYLYGAGALAWNLERTDEATELLNYGIKVLNTYKGSYKKDVNQPLWRLHLYISAIVYRKEGDFPNMIKTLETASKQENCPNMVKAILANIYQKNGKLIESLKLWLEIYDSKDPTYSIRSNEKIAELKNLTGL